MFSEIIGLGASLFGAFGAQRQANMEYSMMMEQLRNQRNQQSMYFGLARDAQAQQDRRNEELRQWEQWARGQQMEERQWQMTELSKYTDQLVAERQYEIERQVQADQEAARIQTFRLQEMLRNQQLTQQERAFALQQLEQAQSIASGERQEDLTRLYTDRLKAEAQRDFMMSVYGDARRTAQSERDADLAIRDRVIGQIDRLQGTVQAAYDSMGSTPEYTRLSEQDIANEIARRQGEYTRDVDRAAEKVASVNEANLIRSGLDRSTPGTEMRGDIAARLANEYQNARARAYDDAMRYITGKVDALNQNTDRMWQQRGNILQELMGVGSVGMDALRALPGVSSAMGGYQMAQLVGDGIYDRGVTSANNYSAPVGIGSGIYESDLYTLTPGMAPNGVSRSAASNDFFNIGSAITNPSNLTLNDPATYWSSGGQVGSNMLSTMASLYGNSRDYAWQAGQNFGDAFQGFMNDNSGRFDSWFSGGMRTSPRPRPNPMRI